MKQSKQPVSKCTKCQALFPIDAPFSGPKECPRCNNSIFHIHYDDKKMYTMKYHAYEGLEMTEEEDAIFKLAEELVGTRGSIEPTIKALGLNDALHCIGPRSVETKLIEITAIDRCPNCGWWVHCEDITDEYGEICACKDCRP